MKKINNYIDQSPFLSWLMLTIGVCMKVAFVLYLSYFLISCNSRTKRASIEEQYTDILILDDSVHAINYHHSVDGSKTYTTLTISFTYNGESRVARTRNYKTAYAINVDSVEHDVAIGYFLLKKDIR